VEEAPSLHEPTSLPAQKLPPKLPNRPSSNSQKKLKRPSPPNRSSHAIRTIAKNYRCRRNCLRRKSEELITSGRVQVNGQVVTELGSKADPEQDHIRVDGKLLQGPSGSLTSRLTSRKVRDHGERREEAPYGDGSGAEGEGPRLSVGRLDWLAKA